MLKKIPLNVAVLSSVVLGTSYSHAAITQSDVIATLPASFDYNAFILNDMTAQNSDVEGKLAVGGNLSLQHYAIGLQLNDIPSQEVLSVNGNVFISDARIYNGSAGANGTITVDETVGLYNGENASDQDDFNNSTSTDFNQIIADTLQFSSDLANWSVNASTSINKNDADEIWNVNFSADNKVNIFEIDIAYLMEPFKRITFDFPTDSLNIVNVVGGKNETVEMRDTGFHISDLNDTNHINPGSTDGKLVDNAEPFRHDGLYANNILFNFVEATSIVMSGIAFKGSILAPLADVTFFNGHVDGNFIVNNFIGSVGEDASLESGQINNYYFGEIPVSAPASTLLVLIAGFYLLFLRRFLSQTSSTKSSRKIGLTHAA